MTDKNNTPGDEDVIEKLYQLLSGSNPLTIDDVRKELVKQSGEIYEVEKNRLANIMNDDPLFEMDYMGRWTLYDEMHPDEIFLVINTSAGVGNAGEIFAQHGEYIHDVPVIREELADWSGHEERCCEECNDPSGGIYRLSNDDWYGIPVCRECLEEYGHVVDSLDSVEEIREYNN